MALVEIKDLTKAYHRGSQRIPVLEGVNLSVERGEFLALMGPSGSGKTTLLNIVAGLDSPEAGSVIVDGEEVTRMSGKRLAEWRARHIGFVFQFYNLLPVLSAYQNVELPLLLTNLSKKERREHVLTAMEVVGLGDRAAHFPGELSGGQQQRVGIARAVVHRPALLLADEPTGNLDPALSWDIMKLFEQFNQVGVTVLIASHDLEMIKKMNKSIITLREGRLLTHIGLTINE